MRRHRVTAGTILSFLLAVAALGISGAPAAADDMVAVDETYIDEKGVVHYKYDPAARPGAEISQERGVSTVRGTCTFRVTDDGVGDGATITIVDEVSFDPASCTRELSIAEYESDRAPQAVLSELAHQEGSEYVVETASHSADAGFAPMASWWQKLSTWYGDPVGIHVSETKIARSWDSGGGWHNTYEWGWYTPSGWARTSSGTSGTATIGETRGNFQNWAFCNPLAATNTYHIWTRLTTSPSGSWSRSYALDKGGDCSGLLSFHYAMG